MIKFKQQPLKREGVAIWEQMAEVADAECKMVYACGMMQGLYGGCGSGIMALSWFSWLLVIGLIISGIYWFIKSAGKK